MNKFFSRNFSELIINNKKLYKFLGYVTVRQNEKAAIYKQNGEISLVDGPAIKFVYRSNIDFLPWYTANENQFIKISYINGIQEHRIGPINLCFDPINHTEIRVMDNWIFHNNQNAIIYEKSKDGSVKSKTLSGPTFYVPEPNETLAYIAENVTATATQYIQILFQDGKTKFLPGPIKIINDPNLYVKVEVKDSLKLTTNQGLIIYQEKSFNEIQVKTVYGPAIYIPDSNEWIHKQINLITVNPNEYLEITYIDGKKEFKQGPYSVWENPITIQSIQKKPVFNIDENECIVVYSSEDKGKILRNIIKGPTQYVPKTNEWIHNFSWHGADPNNTTRKIPNALKFVKLRLVPDQLYHDIENVRTRDDAELTIKLMIFFKIENVDKLLDESHDPVADLINAATSDIIDFVSKYKFEDFKSHIEKLHDLNTFSQIMIRSQAIGYTISKIVFRGYIASKALEAMHNSAIEARTKLVLDHEVEFQKQQIKDFQQQKEKERMEDKLKMDQDEIKMKLAIEAMKLEQDLKNKELEIKAELKFEHLKKNEDRHQLKKQSELELELAESNKAFEIKKLKEINDEEIRKYLSLKEMGVNLTDYLIAKEKGSPSKWIQFDSNKDSNSQVHFIDKI